MAARSRSTLARSGRPASLKVHSIRCRSCSSMRRIALVLLLVGCSRAVRSTVQLENHGRPLGTTGPDAVALPVGDRYRYGVVVGSVMSASGERGCSGEVWLQPIGAPVRDVRTIAP